MSKNELKRSLGFFSLVAFGVGDILGAGVYALIGKGTGLVGPIYWVCFLAALIVAALTGLSYAELGSRFPRSAGESFYTLKAFGKPFLSYGVGFLVLMSGVISMAVVSHAFAGYVRAIWPAFPAPVIILLFFLLLAVINFWGIQESSFTNVICTLVEVSGILVVIGAGLQYAGKVNYLEMIPADGKDPTTAFFQASILAFYAFIGFEDMVKAAEESHQPERSIPRAIIVSLAIVTILYVLTALAAVSVVPVAELARSSAPLMLVVERGFPAFPRGIFTLIALFAVTNTALVNFVMGSRLLYGMAKEGLAPSVLGRVHAIRSTPHVAIVVVFLIALLLALTGTLTLLAQSTSLILLIVFFLVNGSLLMLKIRFPDERSAFRVFFGVPVGGALSALALIYYIDPKAYVSVFILMVLAVAFYFGWGSSKNKMP